ncbi:MAG: hypothetical protein BWY54_00551 [Candidatus Dependentiae bacterium ADurb.Bin331]|nr:MAG: hypothetical protein BWY54_00551 [Candidatus Dependentiae bacterium ADurb.Bin331]
MKQKVLSLAFIMTTSFNLFCVSNYEISALFECLTACPQPDAKIKILEEIKKLSVAQSEQEQKQGCVMVQKAIDNAATKPKAFTTGEWIKSNTTPFLVGAMCAFAIVGILQ